MFRFGKKRDKEPGPEAAAEVALTEERKEELLRIISLTKEQLTKEQAKQTTGEEQAQIYEELGLALYELQEEDQAMDALEKSLQAKKSIGDGYKILIKLYNKKRAEAAKLNDEQSLQLYLKKMDQMLQVSKDVTRGVR